MPKIFSSADGVTWTQRYASPSESDIIRFCKDANYDYAIEGYATARTLRSGTGTSWTVLNTYTGAYVPMDLIAYQDKVSGTLWWKMAAEGDVGKVYSGSSATIATAEYTNVGYWINSFFVLDGTLYACCDEGSTYGVMLRRNVTPDGAGGYSISWSKINSQGRVGQSWRFILATNGYVCFVTTYDNSLYRVAKSHLVAV